MAKPKEPTYQELVAMRQAEWAETQAIARGQLASLHAQIVAMPDVATPPAKDIPWSHHDISCMWCGVKNFYVVRWVTVNGRRHRTELRCIGCERSATWDWTEMVWIR